MTWIPGQLTFQFWGKELTNNFHSQNATKSKPTSVLQHQAYNTHDAQKKSYWTENRPKHKRITSNIRTWVLQNNCRVGTVNLTPIQRFLIWSNVTIKQSKNHIYALQLTCRSLNMCNHSWHIYNNSNGDMWVCIKQVNMYSNGDL